MRLDKLFEEFWQEEHGTTPPTAQERCDRCNGTGVLRGYPGVYTDDDFASGEVDLEDYMDHRRGCEDCDGTGRLTEFTGEAEAEWIEWQRDAAEDRAIRRAESGYSDL